MAVRVVPSVEALREFKAVVLALRLMDKDLRKDINDATRTTMNPVWKALVETNATSPGTFKIMTPGTRIAAGNPPAAKAATGGRKLSGGGTPKELAKAFEFGAVDREKVSTYDVKNRKTGGSHKVRRHTQRQLPAATRSGRVVYPAFAEIGPRMASLWVQIVVKKTHEAFEKGSK
jgi:hypothetical protein